VNSSSPTNSIAEDEPIYLVDGKDVFGEVERAIGISVMGVGGEGGGIFSHIFEKAQAPADLTEFKKEWLKWLRKTFRDQLAEVLVNVFLASTEMRMGRIAELDKELGQQLSVEESKKSREAGTWFLQGKSTLQRAPQWQKYARCVEQGECPGHVVTVFALQAALYHLPLLSALTSYVYFEWRAGMVAFGKEGNLANLDVSLQCFHDEYGESVEVVREVFARDFQVERSISGL